MLLHLPLHEIDIVNVQGFSIPVERNDDTQSHCSLGSSYGHNKKDKNLSVEGVKRAGKGYEGQVSRVEHELNTHENDNGVPSGEHSPHPYKKEDDT
jgi:hypothetical protein